MGVPIKIIDGYILDAPLSYHNTGELPPEGFRVYSFSPRFLKNYEWDTQRFEETENEQQRNNK